MSEKLQKLGTSGEHELGIERLSDSQRDLIVTSIIDGLASQVKAQAGQEFKDPRVLRLLQHLNPALYVQLKRELKALLTLIASPTTAEPVRESLKAHVRRTIEARLGPPFSQVAIAEGMLSNPGAGYYLDSASAAAVEAPRVFEESQKEPSDALNVLRGTIGLKALVAASTESETALKNRLELFVIERLRSAGCKFAVKRYEESFGKGKGSRIIERAVSVRHEDFSKFKEGVIDLGDELGIDLGVSYVDSFGAYRPKKLEDWQVRAGQQKLGHFIFSEREEKPRHWSYRNE